MFTSDPRPGALALVESGDVALEDLWHQYQARGGKAGILELDAFIHDIRLLHGLEIEILSLTLEEMSIGKSKAERSKIGGLLGATSVGSWLNGLLRLAASQGKGLLHRCRQLFTNGRR